MEQGVRGTKARLLFEMDAEQAILAYCLVDNSQIRPIARRILPGEMSELHNTVFSVMVAMMVVGEPDVNLVTLTHRLNTLGQLEKAGGAARVCSLLDAVPGDRAALDEAIAKVKAMAKRRVLRVAAERVLDRVHGEDSPSDIIQGFAQDLLKPFGLKLREVAP